MKLNKMRLHPSAIIENIISWIGIVFALVLTTTLGQVEEIENLWIYLQKFITPNNVLIAFGLFFLFLILTGFISYLIWKRTYIYIDENFNYESGRIFKKQIKINLKDIASITVKKNLLEKLLGTSKIKIELNADSNSSLPRKLIFKDDDVNLIKNIVLKNEEEKIENIESLVSYEPKDIVNHLILSTNFFRLIILLLITICPFIYFIYESNIKSFLILILVLVFISSLVWSVVKKYFTYHNFKLWYEDDKIKVSHGLFSTYRYDIPKNKINAVVISQTLQAKAVDKYLIKIINAGVGDDEGEKPIICLYSDKKTVENLIQTLLPEFIHSDRKTKQSSDSLKIYLINKVPLMFILAGICMFASKYFLLINILLIAWGILQYKTKHLSIGENLITLTMGFFEQHKIIVKYQKLTKLTFTDTFIGKLFNLKYIKMNLLGSKAPIVLRAGYYNTKCENKIIKLLK